MQIEVVMLISVVSVAAAIYFGLSNKKRNDQTDVKSEATALTTVIIKLENINTGVSEIKTEMRGIKEDVKTYREDQIRLEQTVDSLVKRFEICEKHCKRFPTVKQDE